MRKLMWQSFAMMCTLAMANVYILPANAQTAEVKEKPPMYSYISNWSVPRSGWADMEKTAADEQKIFEKALASGAIVAYGNDRNLIHQPDGSTHDTWFSAMSIAGLLNTLDSMYKAGTPTTPVLSTATKHSDDIFVSRYYNWRSGTLKDAYTHGSSYKLKADAPDDAIDILSKNLIVPVLEKLLADGAIQEYEIDTQAIHNEAPGTFMIFYISPNAEGIDKVNDALRERAKAHPLGGQAFGSMTDYSAHRDELSRTNVTYK